MSLDDFGDLDSFTNIDDQMSKLKANDQNEEEVEKFTNNLRKITDKRRSTMNLKDSIIYSNYLDTIFD